MSNKAKYYVTKAENRHNQRQAEFKRILEKNKARLESYNKYRIKELHNIRNKIAPDSVNLNQNGVRL